jgi:hypothetical protein
MTYRAISVSDARRESTAESPAFIWNSTTQELIQILPENHPNYPQNAETLTAALRRWSSK